MRPTLGILGGGQLAKMLACAAGRLGIRCRVWDPSEDAVGGMFADRFCRDFEPEFAEGFCEGLEVATYEFEHVPLEVARAVADRVPLRPGVRSLETSADRLLEKETFKSIGCAVAPYAPLGSEEDAEAAMENVRFPAIIKSRRHGYDGKGQSRVDTPDRLLDAWHEIDRRPAIVEQRVDFSRELSIIVARAHDGRIVHWPLAENHHEDGILRRSIAPAPDVDDTLRQQAVDAATRLAESLGHVGVLTVELFQTADGLVVNEFAPRVHNSGHWTIEGAFTSQFENHVRAVMGWPLGETDARGVFAMVNVIGEVPDTRTMLSNRRAWVHQYGKQPRPGRKLGHVTLEAEDAASARQSAEAIDALMRTEIRS